MYTLLSSGQNPKTLISHKVRMKSKIRRSLIPSRHSLWLRLRVKSTECKSIAPVDGLYLETGSMYADPTII
jgi:hypothetical protein